MITSVMYCGNLFMSTRSILYALPIRLTLYVLLFGETTLVWVRYYGVSIAL